MGSADVVPHPGRTGTHPIVQPEPETPTVARHREDSGPSLWRAFMRGKPSPMTVFVLALLGGGSGVGGSWLLGPGGWSDDAAVRADLAAMRSDIGSMRTSLESCEADIALLDDGQVELYEAVYDQQDKHSTAIKAIAAAVGVIVDVSPPRQRARRVRR